MVHVVLSVVNFPATTKVIDFLRSASVVVTRPQSLARYTTLPMVMVTTFILHVGRGTCSFNG